MKVNTLDLSPKSVLFMATDPQGDFERAKNKCNDGERVADIQIWYKAPMTKGTCLGCGTYQGFMGDVTLASAREGASADTDNMGTWVKAVTSTRETTKCSDYNQIYANEGFTYLPLVADTRAPRSPTFLRFIQFLAEQQADHVFQHENLGGNPRDVGKLFASRGQAQASCAVAIAIAMRIVALHQPRSLH